MTYGSAAAADDNMLRLSFIFSSFFKLRPGDLQFISYNSTTIEIVEELHMYPLEQVRSCRPSPQPNLAGPWPRCALHLQEEACGAGPQHSTPSQFLEHEL